MTKTIPKEIFYVQRPPLTEGGIIDLIDKIYKNDTKIEQEEERRAEEKASRCRLLCLTYFIVFDRG